MALEELSIGGVKAVVGSELRITNVPKRFNEGSFYEFKTEGYVIFPIGKTIPLLREGSESPLAQIEVTDQRNFMLGGIIQTEGEYFVKKIEGEKVK